MSYTALYRKYRPTKFSEIVGQEHITKTLKNQIMAGRVGHAYLLTGGRGTGKTSAAKILARAINCLNPQDGEPCNECEICKSALDGSLTDIVEMDAASNNSVEDIRAIREEVNFLPTLAKYRVYIIDEVHMLSVGAFNALLKTLEEPPEHVKFILATTEPQKLPATILSRCQRFDYKKISPENIKLRLEYICKNSNITITEDALNAISILAEGAMRDALSILERCVQEGESKISADLVKELVGIPKVEAVYKIVNSVLELNVEETLKNINIVISDGKDINNLIWEIIKYVKDILVFKSSGNLNLYNNDELDQIKQLSNKCSKDKLLKIIYSLSELANDLKMTTQKTIMLEVGIMKLCLLDNTQEVKNEKKILITDKNDNQNLVNDDVLNRIIKLENRVNQIAVGGIQSIGNKDNNNLEQTKKTVKSTTKKNPNGVTNIVSNFIPTGKKLESWGNLVSGLKENGKIMLYTNLMNTVATEVNDMTVGIVFPKGITPFGKSILDKPESINELTKLISLEYGKPMQVKYIDAKEDIVPKNDINNISKELGISVNFIDE